MQDYCSRMLSVLRLIDNLNPFFGSKLYCVGQKVTTILQEIVTDAGFIRKSWGKGRR